MRGRNTLRSFIIGIVAVLALCDGDGDGAGTDGGSSGGTDTANDNLLYSCDYTKDGVHLLCTDTVRRL